MGSTVALGLEAAIAAINLYTRLRNTAQQNGELSTEQAQAMDDRMRARMLEPHWRPEATAPTGDAVRE